jgi:hypothetical protein
MFFRDYESSSFGEATLYVEGEYPPAAYYYDLVGEEILARPANPSAFNVDKTLIEDIPNPSELHIYKDGALWTGVGFGTITDGEVDISWHDGVCPGDWVFRLRSFPYLDKELTNTIPFAELPSVVYDLDIADLTGGQAEAFHAAAFGCDSLEGEWAGTMQSALTLLIGHGTYRNSVEISTDQEIGKGRLLFITGSCDLTLVSINGIDADGQGLTAVNTGDYAVTITGNTEGGDDWIDYPGTSVSMTTKGESITLLHTSSRNWRTIRRGLPVKQQSSGITGATFVQNSGNAVNDASTFGGYTLGQLAAAIKALGVLP